jgi:hypothetical protein
MEDKRLDNGEPYRVVEGQPQNKTEKRRLGTDLLSEFVQGAFKSGSVEDFMYYCSSNLLKCYKYVDPPGDCAINGFINPQNPLITCLVTRIRDNNNQHRKYLSLQGMNRTEQIIYTQAQACSAQLV